MNKSELEFRLATLESQMQEIITRHNEAEKEMRDCVQQALVMQGRISEVRAMLGELKRQENEIIQNTTS